MKKIFFVFVLVFIAAAIAGGWIFARRVERAVGTVTMAPIAELAKAARLLRTDKTILVLLLNNTELRPGGGFIGAIGIVTMRGGRLGDFKTHDVYALDKLGIGTITTPPPVPVSAYLNVKAWYLRDANWSPDFKMSSEEVLRAYRAEAALSGGVFPESVDAVVGFTPTFFADLLRITGPLTVDGTSFTPENVTDELEYQVERKFLETGVPREQRKEIIGALGRELVNRLASLPLGRWQEVLSAAGRAFRSKQLMAYDAEPGAQAALESLGWAGRVPETAGDFLMVVDANLASLKSDPFVHRTIAYRLEPSASGLVATVRVIYAHAGKFDWKTTRYRTYTRIYAPRGSTFISGEGAMENDKLKDPARRPGTWDVREELGKAVYGAFISIEPGETRTLAATYRLPFTVSDVYRLTVAKQPGAASRGLTLDLGFGKKLVRATPPEDPSAFGDDRYRLSTELGEDRKFEVDF